MKVGIVGYSGAGKSTTFQWLTGVKPDVAKAQNGQIGIARVPDARLALLAEKFNPKKTTYATVDFLDTPGLMPDERRDNPRRLNILREGHGLLVVLDGYSRTDLAAQLKKFRDELIFADLEIVVNRISRLEDQLKKARPAKEKEIQQAELDLLRRVNAEFEKESTPAALGLHAEEEKLIRSFQLLTLKREVVLVNCGESVYRDALPADLLALSPGAIKAAPKLEMELEELDAETREMFMADLGITEPAKDRVIRDIYAGMGQHVFFTVGEDECRSWAIPMGADAVMGAAAIHTDLAKRMVRAEVIGYDDFVRVGSLKEAKTRGVHRLEAKTYVVKDGDIMNIL